MSFSRARVQRFNDITTSAPSPTRYDPKLGDKTKGGVMGCNNRERTASCASDTLSTGGTPFRTPFSCVKKHSCVASMEKHTWGTSTEKPAIARGLVFSDTTAVTQILSDVDDIDLLRTNCATKNQTIEELQKLVDDLTTQIHSVENKKEELESRVATLEVEKSHLECAITNTDNFETQIKELTQEVAALKGEVVALQAERDELSKKKSEAEERITKLEEGNLEYERRILSLEATLEQIELECKAKVKEQHETCEKLKSSIDCLQDNIATSEMELAKLQEVKSKNEETIFGLETQVSSLNFALESARCDGRILDEEVSKLRLEIEEKDKSIALQEDIITGLDMQMESKAKELEKERVELVARLKQLKAEEEAKNNLLVKQLDEKCNEIVALTAEKVDIEKNHQEELFRLQNEWETKVLTHVQEGEQALLEKEAVLKLADLKYTKIITESRDECDRRIREMENEMGARLSEMLESSERMKEKYQDRIHDLERSIGEVLECKANEAAVQQQCYEELANELSAMGTIVQNLNQKIEDLTAEKEKLELLLRESEEALKTMDKEKDSQLQTLRSNFQEERRRNEKLSEHLGESDSKIADIEEELKRKMSELERLSSEIVKSKHENDMLKVKNLDLQLSAVAHEDKAKSLAIELDSARLTFNAQVVELKEELAEVQRQGRKFQIAITDTRKSLEALGKRLMESENEVERLNLENETIRAQLIACENDKNDIENNYRLLVDLKIDLEQKLKDAETTEESLKRTLKDLELKNCDLELDRNEILIIKTTLEQDKETYEISLNNLRELLNEQNIKMIHLERMSLEQIEAVSQALMSKLEEFERFSTEKIQLLNAEIDKITKEKLQIEAALTLRVEQYENLFTDHDILKTTFEITNKESDLLKAQYEEKIEEVEDLLQEIDRLKNDKYVVDNKLSEVSSLLHESKKELEASRNVVQQLRDDNVDLKQTILKLEEQVGEKQSALDALSAKYESLNEASETLTSTLAQKDEEMIELSNSKKDYQQKLANSTDQVVTLLLDLETERKNFELLEESKKSLTNDLGRVCKEKQELATQLSSVVSEFDALKNEIVELKQTSDNDKKNLLNQLDQQKENVHWKNSWEKLMEEKEAMSKELLGMTEKKDYYKSHCMRLDESLAEANKERDEAVADFDKIHKILIAKDEEIASLLKRINDLETLIGPFREQLEQYETERQMMENDRENLRRQHLEQAAKLGHQNHKQKIQHVVKLKADILELRKENEKLKVELKTKSKVIEKLRENVGEHPKRLFIGGKRPTSTPFKGKENDGRLSPIPGVKQEPMSPGSPLRYRNH